MKTIDTKTDLSTQERLMEMALSSENGLEKLQALIKMQDEAEAKRAKKSYFSAMAKMQGVMPVVKKLKVNTFNQSKFASLDDVVLVVAPTISDFGFSYAFEQEYSAQGGNIRVTCVATHVDGHSESSLVQAPADAVGSQGKANKNAIQANNSTVTYLRRYAFTGVFGIVCADEDIDGRIEGVTQRQLSASNDLQTKLTEQLTPALFLDVQANLYAAQTIKELNECGAAINNIIDVAEQDQLKTLYFQRKEAVTLHG